jgi:hypothetical protein
MDCTPTCFRQLRNYARNGKEVKIVLLPFLNLDYEYEKTGWSDMVRFRNGMAGILDCTSVSLVGGEFAFVGSSGVGSRKNRFMEWIKQPEARLLLTVKEEELLKANDRNIWALRRARDSVSHTSYQTQVRNGSIIR